MSDLMSQDNADQFRAAMRNVADTFNKTPVTLLRDSGTEIPLVAGKKADDVGSYGEVAGEMYATENRTETVERWILSFNRDYLAEKGLIDPDTDEPAIDPEHDRIIMNGQHFSIVQMVDKGIFRGLPISVQLTVVR